MDSLKSHFSGVTVQNLIRLHTEPKELDEFLRRKCQRAKKYQAKVPGFK